LKGAFGGRIISRGLRPALSPDLIPCNAYLWGNFKDKVYRTNPQTEEELKEIYKEQFWKFLRKNVLV
jgi:hypothetical protein